MKERLNKIKTGKAGGANAIDPEIIQWLGEVGKDWQSEIYKAGWKSNIIPKECEENLIIPIHKDIKEGENVNTYVDDVDREDETRS